MHELGDAAVYLDLELPSDRAKLSDPEFYLSSHADQLVILDEIQRSPGIFQLLRSLIDRRRRKGARVIQFLLLGSASIELLQQSAENLAGRIAYLDLTPFTVQEIQITGAGALDRLWLRGGVPESFLAGDDAASFEWRLAFIQTYLERDIPALGPRGPSETLHRFWQMLAHEHGQLLNAARLASGLGVSGQTIARYLDILVDLLLVRRLQPWGRNPGKRRNAGKRLVPAKGVCAIEVKRSIGSPQPSKGFQIVCEDVKATRRAVIYPGMERYRLNAHTEAVPLEDMLNEFKTMHP